MMSIKLSESDSFLEWSEDTITGGLVLQYFCAIEIILVKHFGLKFHKSNLKAVSLRCPISGDVKEEKPRTT